MKDCYLQVAFRRGKPFAAYLYLPRKPEAKSKRTEQILPGLLVDYGEDDAPIGLEITAPSRTTAKQVNEVLGRLGLRALDPEELAPLTAA